MTLDASCSVKSNQVFNTFPHKCYWVPDLNLNKSLEFECQRLHTGTSYTRNPLSNLSTLNLVFLHIPECNLLVKNS